MGYEINGLSGWVGGCMGWAWWKVPEPEKQESVPEGGIPFQLIVLFSIGTAASFARVRPGVD